MPQVIDVPGHGNVEFPDGMSDQDIVAAIKKISAPQQRTWGDSAADFLGAAWNKINPVKQLEGLATATTNPVEAMTGMLGAQGDLASQAQEAFKSGDYLGGVRHAINYLIPLLGPEMDAAGNKMADGKVAEGLGETAGIGANIALPAAVGKIKNIPLAPALENPNPVKAMAAEWAAKQDIPLPAGAATGNTFVKGAQAVSDSTALGSIVADKAKQALGEKLAATGSKLAAKAHPAMMVPETAAEATRSGVENAISMLKKGADVEYEPFNAAVRNPANKRPVQVGTKQVTSGVLDSQGKPVTATIPVTKDISIPVDMRGFKQALKPLYEEMQQWMEPARRDASAGFQAIKSIVEGDDYIPANVAEKGLGGLKTLTRGSESADLRNFSQGIAAKIVPELQKEIDSAVESVAGRKAADALARGRKTHMVKMEAAETLQKLRDEPVQLFNQATYAGDAGIEQLRNVAMYAPKEIPKLGRAYIEKLLDTATQEGEFSKAGTVFNQWQRLGPETKKLLFPQKGLVGELDNFFQVAKMASENPNPSGTYVVGHGMGQIGLTVANPALGITYLLSSPAISKFLHSPAGVRMLTKGMKIPIGNTAAATAIASEIVKIAGNEAIVLNQKKRP